MFDADKWHEIFNSIGRHKLRTALTAFGVAWGIFMLVLLLGAGTGMENGVVEDFKDDAINSIWIYPGVTSEEYNGLQPGRRVKFSNEDYDYLNSEISELEKLSGRYYIQASNTVKYKNEHKNFDTRCVHPEHKFIENTEMIDGRFINDDDLEQFRKVAVIGLEVKDAFFPDGENPIGETITINKADFKIVGFYKDSGGEREMRKIYVPITTAQRIFGGDKRIDEMILVLNDNITVDETKGIEKEILSRFSKIHKFDPKDKKAIWIDNSLENFEQFQGFFGAIKTIIWFVGIGSIFAGIIGVSNIMLIIVKDRTKEIGIRKALGATPASIIGMIIHEAVLITSIAGYFGLFAGIMVLFAIERAMETFDLKSDFFLNPEVDFKFMMMAIIILVISGALAGLIPAMRAVNINPVVAMKS